MGLFSGFSRKEVNGNLQLKIVLEKLQFLASCMENDTDKPSDLKHWQENMTNLYEIEVKNSAYLHYIHKSYHTLYKLYLKRHHPDLVD